MPPPTSELAREFVRWATDAARTNDELYTAELLLEWARVVWGWKHKKPEKFDWPARRAHAAERKGNPAYRAKLDPQRLAMAVEMWEKVDKMPANHDDRPVRDLSACRFFPHFKELSIAAVELADLSPLATLRELRTLNLSEPVLDGGYVTSDFSPIAGLPELEEVALSLRLPWPDLRALGELPALKRFHWTGNLLALRAIEALAEVRVALLSADFHWKTPLRDLRDFPAMPKVERAKIEGVDSLEGIERYPKLRNLDLIGTFRDLTPLTALTELTWLRLEGTCFHDLAPLAGVARLREVVLVRERPLDLSPLAAAPALKEVSVERCAILATELSALNAGLNPWDDEFQLPEARALRPLRFISYNPQHQELTELYPLRAAETNPRTEFYGEDVAFLAAEGRWFQRELDRRLTELLGPGWKGAFSSVSAGEGGAHVGFSRYRDLLRFRDIVRALQELAAVARFPWSLRLLFEPHGDMSEDLEEIRQRQTAGHWWEREFDPIQEKEDHEHFKAERRKRYELMEREHRLRLLEQQGQKIDPSEFSPGHTEARDKVAAGPSKPDSDDAADEDSDDETGGGLMEPPPPPRESQSDLAAKLQFMVTLNDDILWTTGGDWGANAAYAFGREPEDWHSLPEPPAARPYPRRF